MAETRIEVLKDWVDELQRPRKPLTAWELGFLANVGERLDNGRTLSEAQSETLERIYTEKT